MSEENVELVRASIEAYGAGDHDGYLSFFAEDVEVCPDPARFPEARPFRGREEFRRFIADIEQGWEGGATAEVREIFPWVIGSWLGAIGEAQAGPAVSICAPA
jgi:ketosteroid isomerase-like protein